MGALHVNILQVINWPQIQGETHHNITKSTRRIKTASKCHAVQWISIKVNLKSHARFFISHNNEINNGAIKYYIRKTNLTIKKDERIVA